MIDTISFSLEKLKPDIIKIDVEGAEMKILKGMKKTLSKFSPKLLVGIHVDILKKQGTSGEDVMTFLQKNNYLPYKIQGREIKKIYKLGNYPLIYFKKE